MNVFRYKPIRGKLAPIITIGIKPKEFRIKKEGGGMVFYCGVRVGHHDNGGENLLRFCFAKEDDVLDEACRRIERLEV